MNDLPKTYSSSAIEKKWHEAWIKTNAFHASPESSKEKFSMVIPPPNVTGILHMGHALNNTLQDIIARYKRMKGFEVLWLPGTDHAGIATQNVVEKHLRSKGTDRKKLGREAFVNEVWNWRKKHGNAIVEQLKRLGCSCDWERLRFTMDDGLSESVLEVFIRLYKKGLIYRDYYIINWCPRCQTALSDEEVAHKEIEGGLYTIKYAVEGSNDFIPIATTRPETMLGDTAVGFNPNDKRYRSFKGKTVILPLLGRKLKIIQDEKIDPAFGTGALKITPAHDPIDFELGKKHSLESINIFNPDATLNENTGPYKDMERFKARKKIVEDLKKQGLIIEIKTHRHAVGHCYRCETIVEPACSHQWFVKMKPLAEPALQAVKKGTLKFIPSRWTKVYLEWMENIRDWCISRQIWWGHRIPVYYGPDGKHTAARNEAEARRELKLGPKDKIRQDEDVLDTWFSSWLWPFSTLGWPKETKDLKAFYPTHTLVTAYEIIFFWVARMAMAGYEFMGNYPFKDIYIHGIVRDEGGTKMSKSLGNVVDPTGIIDDFGADALRFGIVSITSEGQDVFASKERLEIGRNFTNKIWNASRFTLLKLEAQKGNPPSPDEFQDVDRWILSLLHRLIDRVSKSLDAYRFNEAAGALYEFFWHQFCDWYIEFVKLHPDSPSSQWTVQEVLKTYMKLLHPFMPFISEEISSVLGQSSTSQPLMLQDWPKSDSKRIDKKIEDEIAILIDQIHSIRNTRSQWKVPPKEHLIAVAKTEGKAEEEILTKHLRYIKHLARVKELSIGSKLTRPAQSATATVGRIETYVCLAGLVDLNLEQKRLKDAIMDADTRIKGFEQKLKKSDFAKKAPKAIVEKEEKRLSEWRDKKKRLSENLKTISS